MDKDYILEKWLNGELSEEEKKAFSELDDYQLNLNIIEKAHHFKASNFSNVDDFETFKQAYQSQNQPVKQLNWWQPLLRIAAVLVIGFSIYFGFLYNPLTEIITASSEKTTIKLPDNSEVVLNSQSKLSFDKNTWNDQRSVALNGEAYFKVAKGETFDVITSEGIVTVIGTEFNVKQRDKYFQVTCFEGVVKVVSDTIVRQLVAGRNYLILDGEFIEDEVANISPFWTQNKSYFKAIPLKEVFSELERQYNINLSLDKIDGQRLFTGGFTHENLDNALKSITLPMNLTYDTSTENQVVIYGNKK